MRSIKTKTAAYRGFDNFEVARDKVSFDVKNNNRQTSIFLFIFQVPGGWLAERFGAKIIYGLGVLCTSVFTLVTPLAADLSPYVLIATRVLEGIGEVGNSHHF